MTAAPVAAAGEDAARARRAGGRSLRLVDAHDGGAAPAPGTRRAGDAGRARRARVGRRRRAAWALGGLGARPRSPPSRLWSFLSIVWAQARGDAWDGANRALLYLTVFALFALLPWRAGGGGRVPRAPSSAPRRWSGWGRWPPRRSRAPSTAFEGGRLGRRSATRTRARRCSSRRSGRRVMLAALPRLAALARGSLLAAGDVLLELVVLVPEPRFAARGGRRLVLAVALARDRPRLLLTLVVVGAGTSADAAVPAPVFTRGGTAGRDAGRRLAIVLSAARCSPPGSSRRVSS